MARGSSRIYSSLCILTLGEIQKLRWPPRTLGTFYGQAKKMASYDLVLSNLVHRVSMVGRRSVRLGVQTSSRRLSPCSKKTIGGDLRTSKVTVTVRRRLLTAAVGHYAIASLCHSSVSNQPHVLTHVNICVFSLCSNRRLGILKWNPEIVCPTSVVANPT